MLGFGAISQAPLSALADPPPSASSVGTGGGAATGLGVPPPRGIGTGAAIGAGVGRALARGSGAGSGAATGLGHIMAAVKATGTGTGRATGYALPLVLGVSLGRGTATAAGAGAGTAAKLSIGTASGAAVGAAIGRALAKATGTGSATASGSGAGIGPHLTLLVITAAGVPPYSARGIVQTLEPIALASDLHRSFNGKLVSLAPAIFQKYRTRISCDDQETPAIEGIYEGMQITVDCISELGFSTIGNTPARTAVPGSLRTDGGSFSFYRPRLTLLVTGFTASSNEWGAQVNWSIEAEEI